MNVIARVHRLARALGWGSWRWRSLLRRWAQSARPGKSGLVTQYGTDILDIRGALVDHTQTQCFEDGTPSCLLRCSEPAYDDLRGGLASFWTENCGPLDSASTEDSFGGLTIAVQRHEWRNFFHSLVDLYNIFLVTRFLDHQPSETRVLFLDTHQRSPFEELWTAHFREVLTLSEFQSEQTFERLVIGPDNYNSPFGPCLGPCPPLFEDFSRLYRAPGADPDQLTFVSRRMARQRKLENEEELIERLQSALPEAKVRGVALENYSPLEQVKIMSKTRLLVGLHGAGLTHSVFLPQSAGLFELFPGVLHAFRFHFYNVARWRNLSYRRFVDMTRLTEPPDGMNSLQVEPLLKQIVAHWKSL